jgi:outer membrane immunogenic protein
MNKFLVVGIVAAALLSAPALAGPPPAPFNWSGFYVGVNGGGMDFKTKDGEFTNSPNSFWNTDRKEVGIGGIHGGFQGQWGNLVVGIEGAWDGVLGQGFSTHPGTVAAGTPCGYGFGDELCAARINDILQIGPRVGFAMGQWMIYGTGGYARAEVESRGIFISNGNAFDIVSRHQNGWYWGGGFEWLVMNGFVIGIEYKHFDFKLAQFNVFFNGTNDSHNFKTEADAVLLRLTIKQ